MESKTYYIKNIIKTLGICALGLILGATVFSEMPLFENSAFLTAIVFAGLPFGWKATSDIFGGIRGIGWITILIYYILRLATSFAFGCFIMAFRLVKDIAQLCIVCAAERKSQNTAA